jgi:serine phosphatase RsbU (regulator of sigma subunit)
MSVTIQVGYIIFLFLAFLLISLVLALYFHNRKSRQNRLFALYLIILASWIILGFIYIMMEVATHILNPIQMSITAFAGVVYYYFCKAMENEDFKWKKRDFIWLIPAIYITIYNILRLAIPEQFAILQETVRAEDGKLIREADIHYFIYALYLLFMHLAGLLVLFKSMRVSTDIEHRKRLKTVFFSTLFALIGTFTFVNLFTMLNIRGYSKYSVIFLGPALVIIAVSLLRHKAWTVEHLLNVISEKDKSLEKTNRELRERNMAIEAELDIARLIQAKILPLNIPVIPKLKIATFYEPMDKVGGDYYDFSISDDKLGIFIADVSGHGIPGAFMAGITKMGFRFYSDQNKSCNQMMINLDETISELSVKSMFVTAIYALFDYKSKTLSFSNSGHCPMLIHRRSENLIIEPKTKNPPLGLKLNVDYDSELIKLKPEDRVLFFTDGITESENLQGIPYEDKRFISFIRNNIEKDTENFARDLIIDLKEYVYPNKFEDDLTLVVMDIEHTLPKTRKKVGKTSG